MTSTNKRAIRKLLWANAISGFAQGISMIAIPWYMINTLQDEKSYHHVFLFTTLCILFWGPFAGAIVDRFNRKNIMLWLTGVGFFILCIASITGIYFAHVPQFLIIAVFFFTILNYNLHYPTVYTFMHEISDEGNFGKVNSLIEIQGQSTNLLSGGAAAVLLSGFSYNNQIIMNPINLEWILLGDAITYLISFFIIKSIRFELLLNEIPEKGSVLKRLKSGWNYLLNNKEIMLFGMCSYIVFATLIIHGYFLMQVYLDNNLMAGAFSLAMAEVLYTSGALLSGITIRKIFSSVGSLRGIQLLMFLTFALLLTIYASNNIYIFLFANMLYGFCNSGIRILRVTWLFEKIPNRMMGRAGSAFTNFNILLRFSLLLLFGLPYFLQQIENAFLVMAAVVLIGLLMLTYGSKNTTEKVKS